MDGLVGGVAVGGASGFLSSAGLLSVGFTGGSSSTSFVVSEMGTATGKDSNSSVLFPCFFLPRGGLTGGPSCLISAESFTGVSSSFGFSTGFGSGTMVVAALGCLATGTGRDGAWALRVGTGRVAVATGGDGGFEGARVTVVGGRAGRAGTLATSGGVVVSGFTGLSFGAAVETGGGGSLGSSTTTVAALPLVKRAMVDCGMCLPGGRVTGVIETILPVGWAFGGESGPLGLAGRGDSGFMG